MGDPKRAPDHSSAWTPETLAMLLREMQATRRLNRDMLEVLREIRDELALLRKAP